MMSLVFFSLLLLGLGVLNLLMPAYTRPDLFFGVTVRPDFRDTPPARRLLRRYRATVCVVIALALCIFLVSRRPMVALLAYVGGICVLLASAHHFALRNASPRAVAVNVDLSAAPERMPGGILAPSLPLLLLLGLGAWAAMHFDQLPQRLILHWGMQGRADRWMPRTPITVTAVLALAIFQYLSLAAGCLAILHGSRRISTSGAAAAGERWFRRQMLLLIIACQYFVVLLPAFVLLGASRTVIRSWGALLLLTLIGFIVRFVRGGQGGSRLVASGGTPPIGDRTDDVHWVGGLIYVNRDDRALLVEKRMGIGWTLNLGNPWAWALLAGLIGIPLMIRIALPR